MKFNKQTMMTLAVGAAISAFLIYASNNIDAVEDYLG